MSDSCDDSKVWCNKMRRCSQAEPFFEPYHKWIPISFSKTTHSEHVTGLMCGVCFQELVVSDAHKHRDKM